MRAIEFNFTKDNNRIRICEETLTDGNKVYNLEITEEDELILSLVCLQEYYAIAAKPYVDRLMEINNNNPPKPIYVTIEQAKAMGLIE